MIDGGFVKELEIAIQGPHVVAPSERVAIPPGWTIVDRKPEPLPGVVQVGTLTGLVDYVAANRDGLVLADLIVHVKTPEAVELCDHLETADALFRRRTYCLATTAMVGGPPIEFGRYYDAESFFIALQAGFVPSPDRDALLVLIASIRENSVREVIDSGVAQEVKTGRSVALMGNTQVTNPWVLAPFRTFREIEQPPSRFVLRLKSQDGEPKPRCALFEAEGAAWKLEAVRLIKGYLSDLLPDGVAVIA